MNMKATMIIEGKTFKDFPNFVQGDFGTEITFNLLQESGSEYAIGSSEVRFKAKKYDEDTNKINGVCDIVDASSGIVTYTIQDGDFSEIGRFMAEIEASSPTKIISAKLGDLVIVEENPN